MERKPVLSPIQLKPPAHRVAPAMLIDATVAHIDPKKPVEAIAVLDTLDKEDLIANFLNLMLQHDTLCADYGALRDAYKALLKKHNDGNRI